MIPEDWQPTPADLAFARQCGIDPPDRVRRSFIAWHRKNVGQRPPDISAAWRDWCGRLLENGRETMIKVASQCAYGAMSTRQITDVLTALTTKLPGTGMPSDPADLDAIARFAIRDFMEHGGGLEFVC